jgi:hypothetical protein
VLVPVCNVKPRRPIPTPSHAVATLSNVPMSALHAQSTDMYVWHEHYIVYIYHTWQMNAHVHAYGNSAETLMTMRQSWSQSGRTPDLSDARATQQQGIQERRETSQTRLTDC